MYLGVIIVGIFYLSFIKMLSLIIARIYVYQFKYLTRNYVVNVNCALYAKKENKINKVVKKRHFKINATLF